MKRKRALIVSFISAVSAAGLILAFAGLEAAQPTSAPHFAGPGAEPAHFGGRHHGWSMGMRGRGLRRLCGARRDQRIEDMVALIQGFADFTPAQTDAWSKLIGAVRAGSASIGKACEEVRGAGRPKTAPEKLARVEAMMATGLGVVQQVRPTFEAFYAVLSDKQRKAVDGLFLRDRRH